MREGEKVSERLIDAGLSENEVVKRVFNLLEHCKVGKVSIDETIRIKENCESFGIGVEQTTYFFTTGFLNSFFSAVKNKYIKETKCIAVGDPYCEWMFQ